jgi:hypothetical protein
MRPPPGTAAAATISCPSTRFKVSGRKAITAFGRRRFSSYQTSSWPSSVECRMLARYALDKPWYKLFNDAGFGLQHHFQMINLLESACP